MDNCDSNDPQLDNLQQNEEEGDEKQYYNIDSAPPVNDFTPANNDNLNEENKAIIPNSNSNNENNEAEPQPNNTAPIDKKELKKCIVAIIILLLYIIIDTTLPIIFGYLNILFLVDNIGILLTIILFFYNYLIKKTILITNRFQIYFIAIVFVVGLVVKIYAIIYCNGGLMIILHCALLFGPRIFSMANGFKFKTN